ncbi:DUF3467 domain-containing protein [Candidatus Woesearchaeota archaeon]|nr:DUF3467 domain-containing protein [Candidatus Woesearchaeota archaeon]
MAKEEIKQQKQMNIRVKDEDQFYSNEISINFNPNEIILDFKCITHIHDVGEHRSIFLRHKPIILNPFHAKSFLSMLNQAIKDYEVKFGEIKKPEALKKAEKIVKKEEKDKSENNIKEPIGSYFG